ncbi:MAG: arginase family protein [Coriobacteriia bacterium]|nr:arginase family protein [Coriobacteriia bacterium]
MAASSRFEDALWPRASAWLAPAPEGIEATGDLGFLGVPTSSRSITPSGAHATPAAVRTALSRYSTFAHSSGIDVAELSAVDLGDVADPDGAGGEQRTRRASAKARERFGLLIAIGGDNSITFPVMGGLAGADLSGWGLITLDAHHDLRDGDSNGSPVRRLVEAGLPGKNIVQIGIADFANSAAYAARAREFGITVVGRDAITAPAVGAIASAALAIAGRGGGGVFLDVDVDVCDRSVVPACPSAAPGGISAHELRRLVFELVSDPRVAGMDVTEIDATTDAADGRTVRLAALLVLEAAAAVRNRLDGGI